MRLGAAFWRFWEIRGLFAEGRRVLGKLLAQSDLNAETHAYGWVLTGAGLLAFRQGDLHEAGRLLRHALKIEQERAEPNPSRLAQCLNDVGLVERSRGAIESAIDYYSKYLALAKQHMGARDVAALRRTTLESQPLHLVIWMRLKSAWKSVAGCSKKAVTRAISRIR